MVLLVRLYAHFVALHSCINSPKQYHPVIMSVKWCSMKCKGCGEDKDLIKAHIIPKSFYMNLKGDSKYLNVIHSNADARVGISHIGDYDKEILCKACDGVFEKYDDYAKKFLIDEFGSFNELWDGETLVGWEVDGCKHQKLILFFLSVLWRASVSNRENYRNIVLGPHEDKIKEIVFGRSNDNLYYTCSLAKFYGAKIDTLERAILNPVRIKIDGINFHQIYLGGFIAYLKVDKRENPMGDKLDIRVGQKLHIVGRSFDNSKEYKLIQKIVSQPIADKL